MVFLVVQDGSVGNFLTEQEADGGDSFPRQNFVGQMSASAGMLFPAFLCLQPFLF